MNTEQNIEFWPMYFERDFVVMATSGPVSYPNPLRVMGAARSGCTFVLAPLAEITTPHGAEPRQLRLWIPQYPGIFTFKASRGNTLTGSETARILKAHYDMVGTDMAYLHADKSGAVDDHYEAVKAFDIRTGRPLFRLLDRTSPVNDRLGLELMIVESFNFAHDAVIGDPDEEMTKPPLCATRMRAVSAALHGAKQMILEYRAEITKPVV